MSSNAAEEVDHIIYVRRAKAHFSRATFGNGLVLQHQGVAAARHVKRNQGARTSLASSSTGITLPHSLVRVTRTPDLTQSAYAGRWTVTV